MCSTNKVETFYFFFYYNEIKINLIFIDIYELILTHIIIIIFLILADHFFISFNEFERSVYVFLYCFFYNFQFYLFHRYFVKLSIFISNNL